MLEEKLRKVFFNILTKFGSRLSKLTIENKSEACSLLQAFECKFLARDFNLLYSEVQIFNLLFRGGKMIEKSHSLDAGSLDLGELSKALQQTF